MEKYKNCFRSGKKNRSFRSIFLKTQISNDIVGGFQSAISSFSYLLICINSFHCIGNSNSAGHNEAQLNGKAQT